MKWFLIIVVSLITVPIVLYLGVLAYYNLVGNDQVAEELTSHPDGERAKIVMLFTLPSGRVLPVNYLREGEQVFVGADGGWWKELREGNVPVSIVIKGETLTGTARVVLDDPEYTHDVFSRLRPSAPSWLPDWLNANLIVIDLDS